MNEQGRASDQTSGEWFARADGPEQGEGLRFSCTQCGNCCSGPSGFILVNDEECVAIAAELGLEVGAFKEQFTHMMELGRSLNEKASAFGFDCVFLDRERVPGKAVCSMYRARPKQCRTWPFWTSVIKSQNTWERAKRTCPGIDKGELTSVQQIRILRDSVVM